MHNIIIKCINSLTKEQINSFALKNGAKLSQSELDFLYSFIKNNYQIILDNPNSFNIDDYKTRFSINNFIIIKKVFIEYFNKFKNYL